MSDLTFNIKTTADLAAAEAAAKSVEKLKGTSADLSKEMGVINVSGTDMERVLGKAGKAAEEAEIPHRELKESINLLTKGYPELGEAARAALNPMVLACFAIGEAFNIWNDRLKTSQELLGGIELPDFAVHAAGVSAAAEAYAKLKTAVAEANTEFNSGAAAFERQSTAIKDQLDFTKQLIQAQKNKAIADLDLDRANGKVTPGMYDARKAIIEQGYNAATVQNENDARSADLAAKRQEAKKTAEESADDAAKAAKIHPELNDAGFEELINQAKSGAEAAKKKAEEFRAEQAHAQEVAERAAGGKGAEGLSDVAHNFLGDAAFFGKYGLNAKPEAVADMNKEAAKKQEETAAALEVQAQKLEAQRDQRKKLNEAAAAKAAEAAKIQDEDWCT